MNFKIVIAAFIFVFALSACDKENDNLVKPFGADQFPQVITFDDEGDGDLEDADEFSMVLKLNDRVDPEGEEPGGKIIPLKSNAVVSFEIKEIEGIAKLEDYIVDAKAFYEVDDCTTSEDLGIDLGLLFNPATGKGSVRFPAGVEEIEIAFETDEDYLNDNTLNEDERSITFVITKVENTGENLTFNSAAEFKYEVLDDDAIHGDWEMDISNAAQFEAFKNLFSLVNVDIADLDADDVEKIEISIEYNEVKVVIELKELEEEDDCGTIELVNKVIEIEADIEELTTQSNNGAIEFVGEIEQGNGGVEEFVFKGDFIITGSVLQLVITGEYDGTENGPEILEFEK
jgi:hypothetical protein